jgi:hypothetical protein
MKVLFLLHGTQPGSVAARVQRALLRITDAP